jgi:L-threonine kinase
VENSPVAVQLPGTCGELVQGTLDGIPCLVSCPIDWYSRAEIELHTGSDWVLPAHAPKAVAGLRAGLAALENLQRPLTAGRLHLVSDLPRSRGYGSSTADMGAVLHALNRAYGRPWQAEDVARIAVGVEPSDSSLFPGLALFDHRRAGFWRALGPAPVLSVLVVDPGGEVDTVAFNDRNYQHILTRLAGRHRTAFDMLFRAMFSLDRLALGEAATLSARLHQLILENPLLGAVMDLSRAVGGLGVCRAHSGTLLGVLLEPEQADPEAILRYARRWLPQGLRLAMHRIVDGGPRFISPT